jgi:intracellular multiplication protein IcmV
MGIVNKATKTAKRAAGIDLLKEQTGFLKKMTRSVLFRKQEKKGDSFADLKGMGVDAKKLNEAKTAFKRLTMVFLVLALLVFIYCVLLFAKGHVYGGLVAIAAIAISLSQAFKYHFWYFQVTQQKLGCTAGQWWAYVCKSLMARSDGPEAPSSASQKPSPSTQPAAKTPASDVKKPSPSAKPAAPSHKQPEAKQDIASDSKQPDPTPQKPEVGKEKDTKN